MRFEDSNEFITATPVQVFPASRQRCTMDLQLAVEWVTQSRRSLLLPRGRSWNKVSYRRIAIAPSDQSFNKDGIVEVDMSCCRCSGKAT